VPAVLYGAKQETVAVSIDARELGREYGQGGFFSRLYNLTMGGDKIQVLPREVQRHPVSDALVHVDFLRLTGDSTIHVDVAVTFVNDEDSPGLKRGGVLNVVRRVVELICRADAIPEQLEVDLDGLNIGDSVHISAIDLPEGARPAIADRDFTIATIAAPTVMVEEETAEGEEDEDLGEEVELDEEAAAAAAAETPDADKDEH
jgi:large subunit ribosomal protein L25